MNNMGVLIYFIIWIGIPVFAIYSFIALIVECVRAKKEYRKIRSKVLVRFIVATIFIILLISAFLVFVYMFSGQ